jgi:hypothetical protein
LGGACVATAHQRPAVLQKNELAVICYEEVGGEEEEDEGEEEEEEEVEMVTEK